MSERSKLDRRSKDVVTTPTQREVIPVARDLITAAMLRIREGKVERGKRLNRQALMLASGTRVYRIQDGAVERKDEGWDSVGNTSVGLIVEAYKLGGKHITERLAILNLPRDPQSRSFDSLKGIGYGDLGIMAVLIQQLPTARVLRPEEFDRMYLPFARSAAGRRGRI